VVLWLFACSIPEEDEVAAPCTVTGTSMASIEYRWDLLWVKLAMDVWQRDNPNVQIKVE
jgi:hypothetical protein